MLNRKLSLATRARYCLALGIFSFHTLGFTQSLDANWIGATTGTTDDAAHRYTNTSNWVGSVINDVIPASATLTTSTTLYFDANHATGTTGLQVLYTGTNQNLTLQGNTSGGNVDRTLTLGGNVFFQPTTTSNVTLTLGTTTANRRLFIDLGGQQRTFFTGTATVGRNISVSNAISNGSLVKDGAGSLTLGDTNLYSGPTTVMAGNLTLNGSILNTTSILLQPNGANSVTLNNIGMPAASDRLGDATPIIFASGSSSGSGIRASLSHSVLGNAAIDSIENVGSYILRTGQSSLSQGHNSATPVANVFLRINADNLTRENRTLATFTNQRNNVSDTLATPNPSLGVRRTGGTANGGNQLFFDSAPTTIGGNNSRGTNSPIVPFIAGVDMTTASGLPNTLMTYNASEGLRALRFNTDLLGQPSEFVTTVAAANADGNDNVRTAGETLSLNRTVNALVLGGTVNLAANTTLSINSGALLMLGSTISGSSSTTSVLDFGSAEGVIMRTGASFQTINARIAGSNGITVTNSSTNAITNLSGSNTYTGQTTLVDGELRVQNSSAGANDSLPDSGTILLHPGTTLGVGSNNVAVQRTDEIVGAAAGVGNIRLGNGSSASVNRGKLLIGGALTDGASGEFTLAGGTLAPGMIQGDPVGTLNFTASADTSATANALRLKSGLLDLDIASASLNDMIRTAGNTIVENNGSLTLDLDFGTFLPTIGQTWYILVAGSDSATNTVSDANGGLLFDLITSNINGGLFSAQIDSFSTGTNNAISVTLLAIPEPASLSLLALASLMFIRKRNRV